jgi:hypothetical protein
MWWREKRRQSVRQLDQHVMDYAMKARANVQQIELSSKHRPYDSHRMWHTTM